MVLKAIAYILFFMLLVFPMDFELLMVKASLFAILSIGILLRLRNDSIFKGLHSHVVFWSFSFLTVSAFFVAEGVFLGFPGATRQAQIYMLWPAIYTLFLSEIRDFKTVRQLHNIIIISTFCISTYGIICILTDLNILPPYIYQLNPFPESVDTTHIGLHEGYIRITFLGIATLPFVIPYVMATLFTPIVNADPNANSFWSQIWLWTVTTLGILCAVLSGRRVIWIDITLTILFLLFINIRKASEKSRKLSSCIRVMLIVFSLLIALAGINSVHEFSLAEMYNNLITAVDFSQGTLSADALERRLQFMALTDEWGDNPLLGKGHGSYSYNSIRDVDAPWSYELSYIALLFQTGLIGFGLYAAGIIWIYYIGVKIIKQGGYLGNLMFAALVGMSSLLVANATNPYLARYDGWWIIFYPIAIINYYLLHATAKQDQKLIYKVTMYEC